MSQAVKPQVLCRVCKGILKVALSLGSIAPSAFVADAAVDSYPLQLCNCEACGLIQLSLTLDADASYRQYWYKSALNKTMVVALHDVVQDALRHVQLNTGDVVCDIGCNDGTLLSMIPPDIVRVGFDPALNLADAARQHCSFFVNDYFSLGDFPINRRAKLITSVAMLYDVQDPDPFVADIAEILHRDGIWVVQMMDLQAMLEQNAFDNICFEHLVYYSLAHLQDLIRPLGLTIFNYSRNAVNGGSLRAMICHDGKRAPVCIPDNMLGPVALQSFAERVDQHKQKTVDFIKTEVAAGKRIYALGASTKGNTLLQYYGLDSSLITKAADVNPDKWGLKTVGSGIPIADERECLAEQPDYFLVLPWHFLDDFVKRHSDYFTRGGQFIVPLPYPIVVSDRTCTLL